MPSETIHWGKQYTVVTHPETEHTGGWDEEVDYKGSIEGEPLPVVHRTPSIAIHWTRPGDHAPVEYTEDPEGHVQITLDVSAREILLAAESVTKYGATSHGFFTDSLSRYQINKLIKILKRARDAAKGVDE